MNKISHINTRIMPYIIWTLRILIGGTLIISGLTKMIDLWGFMYKIEQYLNVWGWDISRSIVIITAIGISAIEFVIGILLLTGAYRRSSAWIASSIMAIMLPLSAYIMIANPVDDCGCFGDFIKISNTATFLKNIFICLGLIYLLFFNHKIKGIYHTHIHWLIGGISYIYILSIGLLGYNIQPLIDFRQYKIGSPLVRDIPINNADNYSFIYEKDGIQKEFNINSLPDSSWTFVDRLDPIHNNSENINDISFSVYDEENNEVTAEVISNTNKQILLLIPDIKYADISYAFLTNEMYKYATQNDIDFIGVFATKDHSQIQRWRDITLVQWPSYMAEDTSLKEIARGKIAVVYINNGIIQWKRTLSSIPSDIFSTPQENIIENLNFNGEDRFKSISFIFVSILTLILILNISILAVKRSFSRKNEKKNVTLQDENKIEITN